MLGNELSLLAQGRIRGRIPLIRVVYSLTSGNAAAKLLDQKFRISGKKFLDRVVKNFSSLLNSGLKQIFKPETVRLQAPFGYAYQKPRGSKSTVFLKPDLALDSSSTVCFVALAAFHKMLGGRISKRKDLQDIYVDTMAISPVAYSLKQLIELCNGAKALAVESFHSYDGLELAPKPLRGTSICLISASSSMSLHSQWLKEKEVAPEEVLTLLTFDDVRTNAAGALLKIARPAIEGTVAEEQLCIHILGETFLPIPEPTKKVLLTQEHHQSPSDVKIFHELAGSGIFDIYRQPSQVSAAPRGLYVDGQKLIKHDLFKKWLSDRLLQSLKASVRFVIHQTDKDSQVLAASVVLAAKAFGLSIKTISSEAIGTTKFNGTDGVIVCAAVIGKGSQLLQISRDLRGKHEGPRLYVIGMQVAETRSEITNLRNDLVHSKDAEFEVARYGAAAIGTQLLKAYQAECSVYYPSSQSRKSIPVALASRASRMGTISTVGNDALLPTAGQTSSILSLRPGFAFWPQVLPQQTFQPEVIATIAVLLQRARELETMPEKKRLHTLTFGHVALDPANFTRFNDGVIQGALLRSAYPSELDFRADYAASDFVKSLICRMLSRAQSEAGEAVLEFLAALGTRRLQILEEHLAEVLSMAATISEKNASSTFRSTVRFLIAPLTSTRKVTSTLPF
jgi:hypothetical protein